MKGVSGVFSVWTVVCCQWTFFLFYYGFIALYGHCMNEWA